MARHAYDPRYSLFNLLSFLYSVKNMTKEDKTIPCPKKILVSAPSKPLEVDNDKSNFSPFPVNIGEPFDPLPNESSRPATPFYLTPTMTSCASSSSSTPPDGNKSAYTLDFFQRPVVSPRPGDAASLFKNNNWTGPKQSFDNASDEENSAKKDKKQNGRCCGIC